MTIESNNVASGSIFIRLRNETQAEHRAMEAALSLTDPGITTEYYRQILARFLGFYQPLEAGLHDSNHPVANEFDLSDRRKTLHLEADLRAFGLDPQTLAICRELPSISTIAQAFGVIYVLEGATLGGQIISSHLSSTLGITRERGGRFFYGYGERTGTMWQSFRGTLDNLQRNHILKMK